MARPPTVEDRILAFVSSSPGCLLEQVVCSCADLQWHQVFLAIDRMSRSGELRLHLDAPGKYALRLPERGPRRGCMCHSYESGLPEDRLSNAQ